MTKLIINVVAISFFDKPMVSSKTTRKRLSVSLDPLIVRIIDNDRGLIRRSTYINFLLEQHLEPQLRSLEEYEKSAPKIEPAKKEAEDR